MSLFLNPEVVLFIPGRRPLPHLRRGDGGQHSRNVGWGILLGVGQLSGVSLGLAPRCSPSEPRSVLLGRGLAAPGAGGPQLQPSPGLGGTGSESPRATYGSRGAAGSPGRAPERRRLSGYHGAGFQQRRGDAGYFGRSWRARLGPARPGGAAGPVRGPSVRPSIRASVHPRPRRPPGRSPATGDGLRSTSHLVFHCGDKDSVSGRPRAPPPRAPAAPRPSCRPAA